MSNKAPIYQYTHRDKKRQEKYKGAVRANNQWRTFNQEPVEYIKENPEHYFAKLSDHKRRMLNVLIRCDNRYPNTFMNQTNIGKEGGTTRQTANKTLKELEELGLISTKYRHMRTCFYKISSYFHKKEIRDKLSYLFPALKNLPIVLLLATTISFSMTSEINLHSNLKDSKYKNYLYNTPVTKHKISDNFGEVSMAEKEREKLEYIPEYVKRIKSLQGYEVTVWGHIRLAALSKEAVEYAQDKIVCADTLMDPFRFFFKQGLDYMRRYNQEPQWSLYYELARVFAMPENAPFIKKVNVPEAKISAQRPFLGGKKIQSNEPVRKYQTADEVKKEQETYREKRVRPSYTRAEEIANLEQAVTGELFTLLPSLIQEHMKQKLDQLKALQNHETLQNSNDLTILVGKKE